ncbi:MAG: DUF1343 domain-containing protein [Bacteroidales bacterium]|nr:DUF1343 domain-containing protein [Bacteroidales bacterium]
MFSFRTTPIGEQMDRTLREGKVGVFATQNSWDPSTGMYLYEIFESRGNLEAVFSPSEAELGDEESHIEFDVDSIAALDAVVVEIQDAGSRYFPFTVDFLRLMSTINTLDRAPSLYVIDHPNPAGRNVEGTMPSIGHDIWTPQVPHRHGLTLGELAHLYYNEISAHYPLHLISASACASGGLLMPWSIAPSPDITGFFSCQMYSGGALWKDTSITPGIGTPRPYEYFGAPFIRPESGNLLPVPEGVKMRPCTFTPSFGPYAGEKCSGYQTILLPGAQYHSLLHTLRLMKHFLGKYSQFTLSDALFARLADPVCEAYLRGDITFDIVQEHVKAEEQKWIRKAKRFVLYDDTPCRIK